ncbi:MAG: 5,6-dimethylbenzimidazole synthase [Pseudomonadota bacterium]
MHSFPQSFRDELSELMRWRRDVRRFRTDPVEAAVLDRCLASFACAPSVGLSEPWRLVQLTSPDIRQKALANYERANAEALKGYSGDQAARYATLKLSGMQEAPVQLAVYCAEATEKGAGLGAATMPEARRYSVVGAIMQFWLTARAEGLGVGWVSVLDPEQLNTDLNVPKDWHLVAYLCVGWPEANSETPELETLGWEQRAAALPLETR